MAAATSMSRPEKKAKTTEEDAKLAKQQRRRERRAAEEKELERERKRRAAKKGPPPTFKTIDIDDNPADISTLYGGSYHSRMFQYMAGMRFEDGRIRAMERGGGEHNEYTTGNNRGDGGLYGDCDDENDYVIPSTPLGLNDPETRRKLEEEEAREKMRVRLERESTNAVDREKRRRRACVVEISLVTLIASSIVVLTVLLWFVFGRK